MAAVCPFVRLYAFLIPSLFSLAVVNSEKFGRVLERKKNKRCDGWWNMVELRMRTSKSLLNFFGKLHRQWKTIPRKTRWRTMYAKKSVGWTFLVCVCVCLFDFFLSFHHHVVEMFTKYGWSRERASNLFSIVSPPILAILSRALLTDMAYRIHAFTLMWLIVIWRIAFGENQCVYLSSFNEALHRNTKRMLDLVNGVIRNTLGKFVIYLWMGNATHQHTHQHTYSPERKKELQRNGKQKRQNKLEPKSFWDCRKGIKSEADEFGLLLWVQLLSCQFSCQTDWPLLSIASVPPLILRQKYLNQSWKLIINQLPTGISNYFRH